MMQQRLPSGIGSRCVATVRCREILALPFSLKERHDSGVVFTCVHER